MQRGARYDPCAPDVEPIRSYRFHGSANLKNNEFFEDFDPYSFIMPKLVQHNVFLKYFYIEHNISTMQNLHFWKMQKRIFFWKLCSLMALVLNFTALPVAARYALAIPLAWCEALSFHENFCWTAGRVRGGAALRPYCDIKSKFSNIKWLLQRMALIVQQEGTSKLNATWRSLRSVRDWCRTNLVL